MSIHGGADRGDTGPIMSMNELIEVSRRYGADPEYVVAGGGNTSWKNAGELYVKGSGVALESVDAAGFVRMDRKKLAAIWSASYPSDPDARESAVLADMMAARFPGEEKKRPSVETLLHDILPYAFVVHTHPALVNGVTCSSREASAAKELFGDEVLWIPSTNPGYILSQIVKDAFDEHTDRTGKAPAFILLQNHGIFVYADAVAGIDETYARVMKALSSKIARRADFSPVELPAVAANEASAAAASLARLSDSGAGEAAVHFAVDAEIRRATASEAAFSAFRAPFSPDHIVYAGSDFLWADSLASLPDAYAAFVARFGGRRPKLAAVKGLGVFGLGAEGNGKSARLAVELFRDAAKIAAYTEAFGGPRYMTQDQVDFINNWEVEQYRSKISTSK